MWTKWRERTKISTHTYRHIREKRKGERKKGEAKTKLKPIIMHTFPKYIKCAKRLSLSRYLAVWESTREFIIPVKWIFDCIYHHRRRHRCRRYSQYASCRWYFCSMIAVSAISLLMFLWVLYRWHYVNTRCDALIFDVFLCRE